MSITRRAAFSLIPALAAAGSAIPAFAAKDDALPSATFPFESMPVQDLDHAQMREILKGKLATGSISKHMRQLCPQMVIRIRPIVTSTRKCGLSARELSNLRLTTPAIV